jgi:signal transduction histidine kinase
LCEKNIPPFDEGTLRFNSLKTKITLLTVLLSTVTTGFLGGYLVWKSYQSLRLQAEQAQLALAKTLAWQANEGLSRAFQSIQVLSKRPETIHLEKGPLIRELTLVTTATESIDGFLLLKPNGKIFAQSLSTVDPENLPPGSFFRENVQRSRELKNSVLVDLYKTGSNNRGVAISTPVFQEGILVGVLVGIMYLPNHTIGNLETARIGKTGFAYMVNQDGIGIVYPDRTKWLTDLSAYPPVAALKKQKEGVIQFIDGEGKEILAAYATVETSSWGVVVRQPAAECFAPAAKMLRFMSLFLAFALLASVLLSLTLSDRVVQPILELAEQVGRYENGKLDPAALETSRPGDEVGLLRHALSRMAHTIQTQAKERERAYARTLEAERKLAESERLATLGQFSAGLAHELNNPLAVILGSAQMAKDARGSKLRNWLDEIYREGNRCRRLVSDLLNFAKPIQLESRNMDLAVLILEAWNQTGRESPGHRLKMASLHFQVWGDPDRLKQVFFNLFKNAREAMPGGGEVRVDLKKLKKYFIVTLADRGKGVRKKDRPKLFRPFFTTKSGGTGLGLAIARSILQAHQGSLSLEPNRPRGVKIILRWPEKPKALKRKV